MAAPHKDSRGIAVRDQAGGIGFVKESDFAEVSQQGYVPVTTAELAAEERRRELEGPMGALKAAGLGALRGATVGLSDLAIGQTSAADDVQTLREVQPGASAIGEFVGGVAGALVPGAPVARIGAMAAKSVGGGAARQLIARGIVEGATTGVGLGAGEMALTRSPATSGEIAETLAIRGAEGAALGGITSLGFLGLSAAARGAIAGVKKINQLGRKPTALATAAANLESLQGQTAATDFIGRRVQLQIERDQLGPMIRKLKSDGNATEAASAELRKNVLDSAIRDIDKEIITLNRVRNPPSTTTLKTVTKSTGAKNPRSTSTTSKTEVNDELGGIAEKLSKGEDLSTDDMLASIRSQQEIVKQNWHNVNASIEEMRRIAKLQIKRGNNISQEFAAYDQYLEEARDILALKKNSLTRDIRAIREAGSAAQGMQMSRVLEGVGQRIRNEESSVVTNIARSQTTDPIQSSIVTRIVKSKAAAPIDAAARTKAREKLLGDTSLKFDPAMLSKMSEAQTGGDVGSFLAWRSASTLLGFIVGDVPGAIIGSIAGARGGQGLQQLVEYAMPTLSRAAPVARAILGAGVRGARQAPVSAGLAMAQLVALSREVQDETNDPDMIYADTYAGYRSGGLDPISAQAMAAAKRATAQVLRDNVPKDMKSAAQRRKFSDVYAAASNPRSISDRIASRSVTEGDMVVLDEIFPTAANEVRALGRRLLTMGTPSSKDRRYLETLAFGRPVTSRSVSRALGSMATPEDEAQTTSSRPVPDTTEEPTAGQRIGK